MKIAGQLYVATGFMALLLAGEASASPILSTTGGAAVTLSSTATVGWAFQTGATPVTVTALDATLNNGVTATIVRIYSLSGAILASSAVTTLDTMESAGLTWFSHAITPVTLPTNSTLYIAEDAPSGLTYQIVSTSPTMGTGVAYGAPGGVIRGVSTSGTGGTPTTDGLGSNSVNPSYFGPNFDVSSAVTTPEPGSILLFTLGLGAIGALRRSRRTA